MGVTSVAFHATMVSLSLWTIAGEARNPFLVILDHVPA
jgi:hypothetical protein